MPHAPTDPLHNSDAGLSLIEQFEGFEPDWYLDPVGVRTIAFGWTHALPDGLTPPLTRAQGRQLLRDTVGRYEDAVRELVKVPLGQGQFDALVSFTYNVGRGALASSTLLRKLNGGEPDVGPEFDRWVKAGGQVLKGLVRRRAAERALFESSAPKPALERSAPVAPEDADVAPVDHAPPPPAPEPNAPPSRPPAGEAVAPAEHDGAEPALPQSQRRDFEKIHPAAPHFLDRDVDES